MSTLPLNSSSKAEQRLRSLPTSSGRSKTTALIGVVVIAGFTLAFVLTAMHVDKRPSVLVVRNAVSAGQIVKASDLAVAKVSADATLKPVSSARLANIVGRPAAVPLVPGTLLTDAQLGTNVSLSGTQTLVGVSVKAGEFPPGLNVGAQVQVIQTASDGTGTVIADGAIVTSVSNPSSSDLSGGTVVGLKVDSSASAAVTAASASSRVGLVQEPAR